MPKVVNIIVLSQCMYVLVYVYHSTEICTHTMCKLAIDFQIFVDKETGEEMPVRLY